MTITVGQIKAARALLNWTQRDLAKRSGYSLAAVNKLERESVTPRESTLSVLQNTFESHGVAFTDGPGVRLTQNLFNLKVLEGKKAIPHLMDDVFLTLKNSGGEVLVNGLDESRWKPWQSELDSHVERMKKHRIGERLLICEGDTHFLPQYDAIQHYRWISRELFTQMPYFIYGSKVAVILWGSRLRVMLISSQILADTYRKQFNANWRAARRPEIPVRRIRD